MNVFEWSKAYFRNGDPALRETRSTMAALMTYADFNKMTCYPSQATLAHVTGSSVETIRRHIRKNVEAGWIRKLAQGSSVGKSTEYLLTTPLTDEGSHPRTPLTGEGTHTRGDLAGEGTLPSRTRGDSPHGRGDTPLTDDRPSTHGSTQRSMQGTIQASEAEKIQASTPSPFEARSGSMNQPTENERSSSSVQPPTESEASPRTDEEIAELMDEVRLQDATPEERLLAAIRTNGSVRAKSGLAELMGVDQDDVNEIVPRLIAWGVIVHDKSGEHPLLTLA